MLLVSICLCSASIGCQTARPEATVRPLDSDFTFVSAGDTMTFKKAGAFCSDEYLEEILLVKAKEAKK